jgi:hypothetical protein
MDPLRIAPVAHAGDIAAPGFPREPEFALDELRRQRAIFWRAL